MSSISLCGKGGVLLLFYQSTNYVTILFIIYFYTECVIEI